MLLNKQNNQNHFQTDRILKLVDPLRLHDEIVPDPNQLYSNEIHSKVPVTMNHPFHSHISQNALFPKFTMDRSNSIRNGCISDNDLMHGECPSRPYTVHVIRKFIGGKYHEDVQTLTASALNKGKPWVDWPGYRSSRYSPLSADEHVYPIPPKINNPNDQRVVASMNPKHVQLLKNIEREQWMTTNQKQFGPRGALRPLKLDNWEDKREEYLRTLKYNDDLAEVPEDDLNEYEREVLFLSERPEPRLCATERSDLFLENQYNGLESWTPRYRRFDKFPEGALVGSHKYTEGDEESTIGMEEIQPLSTNVVVPRLHRYSHYLESLDDISKIQSRNLPPLVECNSGDLYMKQYTRVPFTQQTTNYINQPNRSQVENVQVIKDVRIWPGERSFHTLKSLQTKKPAEKIAALQKNFDRSTKREEFLKSLGNSEFNGTSDLRQHIYSGKRHKIMGFEGNVFRGVPTFSLD